MGRTVAHVNEKGLRKGPWSKEEDDKLRAYIQRYGHWNWREIPRFAGVSRCGKSCRLRWMNYLRPNIKHGNFTKHEEDLIMEIHNKIGNKWAKIAAELPGRSDNEIKNYWHTHLKKRAKKDQTEPKNIHYETRNYNQESSTNSVIMESSDFGDQNELEAVWASLSSEELSSSPTVLLSSSSSSLSVLSSFELPSSIFGASDGSISSGESTQTYVNEYDDGSFWEGLYFADYDGMKSVEQYASDLNVVDNVVMASGSWHNNDEFMWSSMDDLNSEYQSQFMI